MEEEFDFFIETINKGPEEMVILAEKYEGGKEIGKNSYWAAILYIRAAEMGDKKAKAVFTKPLIEMNKQERINRLKVIVKGFGQIQGIGAKKRRRLFIASLKKL